MFFAPLYNIQLLDNYLMVYYYQGGGDIVIITTPGGDYITGDLVSEDMDDTTFELLRENTSTTEL
jgi:hypothetical protein